MAATRPVDELLTPELAAQELQVLPLGVHRLIARRVLPAGRLGTKAPPIFRIRKDDLVAYVAQNCPDIDLPKLTESGWIAGPPRGRPIKTQREMVALAVEGQRLPESKVEAWKEANRRENTLSVALKVTPAIREIWDGPLPVPLVKIKGKVPLPSPITSLGSEVLADALLTRLYSILAREPMRPGVSERTRAEQLYESPDKYQRLVTAAVAEVLAAKTVEQSETLTIGILKHQVTVKYAIPFSDLTNLAVLNKLASLLL